MKIKRLDISNFKGARSVRVYPTDVNEVAGQNGAGKTSVLDGIVAALAGKRSIDPKPLTLGATKGHVELDLGELRVKRTFTERGGGTLTVTNIEDGSKLGQRHLDSLLGEFTFDPLAFSRLAGADQAAKLRELAGSEWNTVLSKLDQSISDAEYERRDLGRDVQRFGELPALPAVDRVDLSQLAEQLKELHDHNGLQRQRVRDYDHASTERDRAEDDVEKMERVLANAKEALAGWESKLESIPDAEPIRDDAPIREAMRLASDTNAQADAYEQNEARRAELRELRKQHASADRYVKGLRDDRAQYLRSAPLPMPGLDWSADGVTLDGVPLQQLNKSKRLLIGAAIGHAVSGELQVCMIREDGANLVGETWTDLLSWCKENDVQLWVETAGAGHTEDALVITEGELEVEGEA